MKNSILLQLACALLFLTSGISGQKNVLLLISDNQTWHDVGCYGNKTVKTPNIDKLASEGVRFEEAFATTASCGPSRAVMYTGLLTHRNGQYAHPHREHNQQLRDDVTSVFAMLKDDGYRTGLIGKDHIKPKEKYPIDHKPRISPRDVSKMARSAGEFISGSEDPFFLVMAYTDPHPISIEGVAWGVEKTKAYTPIEYDTATLRVPPFLPDTEHVREGIAGYYQQISHMDHGVGLVLEELENSGHKDDTLVIFISDHGTSEPGAMGTHYEPGVRVPFIVRKPGLENPASPNQALVAFTDITPTILDWTGVTFDKYALHGRSILPVLDQTAPEGWDAALLSHVAHDFFAYYPMRTLRERRYKLIWNITPGTEYPLPIDTVQRRTWVEMRERGDIKIGERPVESFLHRPRLELYDLKEDPWETNNLAENADQEERVSRMVGDLVKRLTDQEDPWLRKYHPQGKEQ
ncbi:MAG: sulfatase [Verrucomicrobiales bacterium]|nr:sulfatase [Verrucomicrobiales bacterium]